MACSLATTMFDTCVRCGLSTRNLVQEGRTVLSQPAPVGCACARIQELNETIRSFKRFAAPSTHLSPKGGGVPLGGISG